MENPDSQQKNFGVPPKEDIYERYIGKYYILSPVGVNERYIGLIKEINSARGKITLNPYFGLKYNRKSGKNIYTLVDNNLDMFLDLSKIIFEPTTEESILYNCYLSNKDRIKLGKKEILDKEKKKKE